MYYKIKYVKYYVVNAEYIVKKYVYCMYYIYQNTNFIKYLYNLICIYILLIVY